MISQVKHVKIKSKYGYWLGISSNLFILFVAIIAICHSMNA